MAGITAWLAPRPAATTVYISTMVTLAYIATYGVRYPMFTLDLPADHGGLTTKTWLSIACTAGYGIAKIPAYGYVASMPRHLRRNLVLCLLLAMFTLCVGFFAGVPDIAKIVLVFFGSIPGSWIYGILVTYLEGRQSLEISGSIMGMGLVMAGAASRALATTIASLVGNAWMPLTTAACFMPVGIVCLYLLDLTPPPSASDVKIRAARRPMGAVERNRLLREYWPAWLLLTLNYVLIMAFRGLRDYFASNVYADLLGRDATAADYIMADFPAAVVSCAVTMLASWVRSNWRAINLLLIIITIGGALLLGSAVLFRTGAVDGPVYIVLVGIGMYTAYAPAQAILFDRILGATRTPGTCVFLIFATDGLAYVGTIALLLYKSLAPDTSVTGLFNSAALGLGMAIMAFAAGTALYLQLIVRPRVEAKEGFGGDDAASPLLQEVAGEGGGTKADLAVIASVQVVDWE